MHIPFCKRIYCLFCVILFCYSLSAQIKPAENSILNYRLIGFSFPIHQKVTNYTIEIALGTHNTNDSFNKYILTRNNSKKNSLIIEVPDFQSKYTWRILNDNKRSSSYYHFSTGFIPEIDTNSIRLRILKAAKEYKDAYFFLDATKSLYDSKGRPVWYLPRPESKNRIVRDMKISPKGSITYVIDEYGVYNINYEGTILWQGPNNGTVSGDSLEHYHHEFTQLTNGHYMALAQNFAYWKKPTPLDSDLYIMPKELIKPGDRNKIYDNTPMGTLIEYDTKGNVLWYWKASDHFNGSNLFYRSSTATQVNAHENSFYFDEKTKAIYLSLRNLNRVIKIKYPEGNILHIYGGDSEKPSESLMGNNFFCGQHSCKYSQEGYLYLYNNNSCNRGKPAIVIMKEPQSEKDSLKKVWEYECRSDLNPVTGFSSGGNVIELPDHSLFVSMANPDSKVFIVSKNKEILWSAVAEKWDPNTKKWEPINLYRASIINSRKQLENLIWNSEQ